jgi:hypothetical protein
MFAQLTPPHPVMPFAAHQLCFDDGTAPEHPIPVQHSFRERAIFRRRKKREDGRAASGHPYKRASTRRTKIPQPVCDFG